MKTTGGWAGWASSDFWEPLGPRRDPLIDRLIEASLDGVRIDAPATVPFETRETFPLLIARGCSLREAASRPFANMVVATVVRLETHHVYVGMPFDPVVLDAPPPEPAPPEGEEEPEARNYAIYAVDLRQRLDLAWQRGRFLVTLLIEGQLSNRVVVNLGPTPGGYDDPAIADLLVQHLRELPNPRIWPETAEPVPSFERLPTSPPLPEGVGIHLAFDRTVVRSPGARAILSASVRSRIPRFQISTAVRKGIAPTQAQPVTAVLPITVVLTGTRGTPPIVQRLGVPSFDPIPEGAEEAEVTAHFAIDLLSLPGVAAGRTYFVHAFAGELMAGPTPLAMVEPDALPRLDQ